MKEKIGRNDPCPCGSGKKYKQCCWNKRLPLSKRKFKATVLSGGAQKETKEPTNLMDRTFGNAIRSAEVSEKPPLAPESPKEEEKKSEDKE